MRRLAALLLALAAAPAPAQQTLTYDRAPYTLTGANWMASNYLQALYSARWKAVAFSHDRFGEADGRGGIYFLDDMGRVIRCFAQEAERSPVARIEAVAAIARGLLASRVPGSAGRYWFVIDGRQALFLQPAAGGLALTWLQDTNTPLCTLEIEVRRAGGEWRPAQLPAAARTPEVMEASTLYAGEAEGCRIEARSFCGTHDRAPFVEITTPAPADLRVRVRRAGGYHGALRGPASGGAPPPYVLLRQDGRRAARESEKRGWERPELWNTLDTLTMLAWDGGAPEVETGGAPGALDLTLTWRGARRARLYASPFLEVDASDCGYVHQAAARVARSGRYGLRPFLPARNSNGFSGSVTGLAAAAWLLTAAKHRDAGAVTAAAREALGAAIASERRGYHGEYGYNLAAAAWYLRRVLPRAFDYGRWARVWAERELERCPPGAASPPWSDTALRAIACWRYAAQITGDRRYRDAADRGIAEFDLPAEGPVDAFLWRGKRCPLNGYDCTGAAMLLGEWGARGDARATQMVARAAKGLVCDLGFTPLASWTCDDLLPYYVGSSLAAVLPAQPTGTLGRPVGLNEFVAYDERGAVRRVERPIAQRPP